MFDSQMFGIIFGQIIEMIIIEMIQDHGLIYLSIITGFTPEQGLEFSKSSSTGKIIFKIVKINLNMLLMGIYKLVL